ncbi:hypothetical protein [Candidatus Methanoperedens nitratireducens]|uniref:Uncharacterized protein n=1 Tax=Candidatus Methanoperedens nitratireducens TaxID=1392998 RepID=A0A284VQA6_9EURY|nr:hypothetical protein [Candidatus Methanoperedens nitroreducens]SNQ61398.1 conserved hypothetical protein [Candidatus Methanoperedens nitroreducens]
MQEVEVAETLKTLSARIDELSNALIEKKENISSGISDALTEKKTRAIKTIQGKPFTYLGGAFVGGLALGFLMSRRGKSKTR